MTEAHSSLKKRSFVLPNKSACVGCQICELICSLHHEGKFAPSLARIHVFRRPFEGIDEPRVCLQCPKPKCVDACPEKALVVDERTGAKIILEERCIGCGECASACPINLENSVLKIHPTRNVYVKCDLCGGYPECVKWCPASALLYVRRFS